ncbi:zinc finger HIT domain-containing protein 3 [Tachyglossus aculeatus]|uniref:zinc finger HIT domain-containing protein 3 n=1 Tax=Tachyglossus aculeatus TaxID=9261 RepID=UPI0018F2CF3A|nr:zinc finger HIT domain-containing protein 3 [Tachyglossus aculeatus]
MAAAKMASLWSGAGCGLCDRGPKYRCPACRTPYCSVPCYKKHKEQCNPTPAQASERINPGTSPNARIPKPLEDKGGEWSDFLTSDDEEDRISIQKLKHLGKSEELKNLLLNPHLRTLLLTLDQAEEKEVLMKKYMQEPLFVEFADCCLRIVDPPEDEDGCPV